MVTDHFIELRWGGPLRRRWDAEDIRDVKHLATSDRYVWVEDSSEGFGIAFEDEDMAAAFVLAALALIENKEK